VRHPVAIMVALGAGLGGPPAQAECVLPNFFIDGLGREALNVGTRCAFDHAGRWNDPAYGGPVTRFASSLTAQRITDGYCPGDNSIVVADCQTESVVVFHGNQCDREGLIPDLPSTVECFDGPDGRLEMTQQSTLEQLIATASKNNIRVSYGPPKWIAEAPPWRRIDPLCGCGLE